MKWVIQNFSWYGMMVGFMKINIFLWHTTMIQTPTSGREKWAPFLRIKVSDTHPSDIILGKSTKLLHAVIIFTKVKIICCKQTENESQS